MPLAIDMLVGFFTSTTFIMIIGHHLAPEPIRSVFTTILTVKARGHLGDVISVESTGHCHLDHERAPCSEVILTLLQQGLSGYESSEELFLLADESRVLAGLQEFLLTSNTICMSHFLSIGEHRSDAETRGSPWCTSCHVLCSVGFRLGVDIGSGMPLFRADSFAAVEAICSVYHGHRDTMRYHYHSGLFLQSSPFPHGIG